MLSEELKNSVSELSGFDKALLMDYLYEIMDHRDDSENLKLWIKESEDRLAAVKRGDLELVDYSALKSSIK